jgi:hypothetical protein
VEQEGGTVGRGRERLQVTALQQGAHRTCLDAGRNRACDECIRIVDTIIDEAARKRARRTVRPSL